jgi:hypothetical protein
MSRSARFVRESVEDAKSRWPQPNCEPGDGCRFLLNYLESALQELFDSSFFAGLGF